MKAQLIEGGSFQDSRGSISFVNDFCFKDIVRFYILENSEENKIRAWQGHKLDCKNFYCLVGSFRVSYVKIDNWDKPSKALKVESVILRASKSQILSIPAGYANAIESLEANSKLISFSTLPLDEVKDDDVRYNKDMWLLQ
ncbi:dTDP-4-dehydrorhamnose 3,5-epimerase [Dysgonomonas alginatilytica]|uniref:dTDP-4-dehydrorhamnose 3,5-epimerase n=1 Tax=Dysgonomonas alginatilytica TaxID=1605892 RepID=A0A2V3PU31_9BACT|nr:hypothetical protein [Dysgonomonas alginatilytica]PXV62810.1 dTDP-4-dehydrorhamnose 3,5-epimerase [Dysgonomonas alginatilytica]